MITAGTVAAYLTLSTTDFKLGIADAIGMLSTFKGESEGSASGVGVLQGAINTAAQLLRGDFPGALSAASQAASGSGFVIPGAMLAAASSVCSSMSRSSSSALSTKDIISNAMWAAASSVRGSMQSAAGGISIFAAAQGPAGIISRGIASNVLSPLLSLRYQSSSAMKEVGNGMVSGLASKTSAIMAKARSIANSVAATMRSALGIASPSKVMRLIGTQTAQGMMLGIGDMQK
ncbi:MAG: hypothetical protein IJC18_05170, partial [Clostridia bacterium]|nr:hypothetical protein [Clostridia bacterium]